jgi:hypothetical protein
LNEKKKLIRSSASGIEQEILDIPEGDCVELGWNAGKLYILGKEKLTVYETQK